MRALLVAALAAQMTVCCCSGALGLAAEIRPPAIQQPHWPAGLADLLNSRKWVYAYFINASDSYHYSGDAKAFNEFVAKYAELGKPTPADTTDLKDWDGSAAPLALSETPLRLLLHPGRGMTGYFDVERMGKTPFDWRVTVGEWLSPGTPADYKMPATLELWVGGNVKLAEVKVPLNVEVRAARTDAATPEIEKFIADREAKRKAAEQPGDTGDKPSSDKTK